MATKPKNKGGRPRKDGRPWHDIRNALMLGESSVSIGKRYGIPESSIRCRAMRENWITAGNIDKRMIEQVGEIHAQAAAGDISIIEAAGRAEAVRESTASLKERQREHVAAIEGIAGDAFGPLRARKRKLPIKSWRDAKIADDMARRAMGMDQGEPEHIINVAVLSGGEGITDVEDVSEG